MAVYSDCWLLIPYLYYAHYYDAWCRSIMHAKTAPLTVLTVAPPRPRPTNYMSESKNDI